MIRYTDMINTIFQFENERGVLENDRYTKFDDSIKAAVATTNDNNKIIEKYHEIIDIYENEEMQAEEQEKEQNVEDEKSEQEIELNTEEKESKIIEIEKTEEPVRENNADNKTKKRMFLLKKSEETDIISKTKIVVVKCLSDENYDKAVYSIKNSYEAIDSFLSLKDCKKMIGFEYRDDIYIIAGQDSDNDLLEVYVTEEDRKTFGDDLNRISLYYVDNIVNMIKKKEEEYAIAKICQDNKEYTDEDFNKIMLKDVSKYENIIIGKEYDCKDFRKKDFKNFLFIDCKFKNNLFVDSLYTNTVFYKCIFEKDVFCRSNITNQDFVMCQGNYYDTKGQITIFKS